MKLAKTWVLRIRTRNRIKFNAIKSGRKIIETRALGKTSSGKNFGKVAKFDWVIFICGKNKLKREVKKVQKFRSLEEMFNKLDMEEVIPYARNKSLRVVRARYFTFLGYKERIQKHGLIAFWI